MATGPLSLLGEAMADASRTGLQIKLREREDDKRRQQQLDDRDEARVNALNDRATVRAENKADRAEARGYAIEDRNAEWAHADATYTKRQMQAIVTNLIAEGYLDPNDADQPEAVSEALKAASPATQRNIKELSGYQAALPGLIQHVGTVPGATDLLKMKPGDISDARAIMAKVIDAVGAKAQKQIETGETADKNAAAYGAVQFVQAQNARSKLDSIDEFVDSVRDGSYEPSPEEVASARSSAIQKNPDLAKVQNLKVLQAAIHTELFGDGTPNHPGSIPAKAYMMSGTRAQVARELNDGQRNLSSVDDMRKAGLFNTTDFTQIKVDPTKLSKPTTAPRGPRGSIDDYLKATGATSNPNATNVAPPSSLVDTMGPAVLNTLAIPGKVIDRATAIGGGLVNGLVDGDMTPSSEGLVTRVGKGIGSLANMTARDTDPGEINKIDAELNQLASKPPSRDTVSRTAYLRRLRDSYTSKPTASLGLD